MFRLVVFCILATIGFSNNIDLGLPVSNSFELHAKNWIKKTAGKTLFVNFCETFYPECRQLRSIWDKAAEEYKDHPDLLMAHIDCSGKGRAICKKFNIGKHYPEYRFGHPENLIKNVINLTNPVTDLREPTPKKLINFASQIKFVCSIQNLKACSEVDKHRIVSLAQLSIRELTARVRTFHKDQDIITQIFRNNSLALKEQYNVLEKQYFQDLETLHDKNYIHLIQDVLSRLIGEIDPKLLVADELSDEMSISL